MAYETFTLEREGPVATVSSAWMVRIGKSAMTVISIMKIPAPTTANGMAVAMVSSTTVSNAMMATRFKRITAPTPAKPLSAAMEFSGSIVWQARWATKLVTMVTKVTPMAA